MRRLIIISAILLTFFGQKELKSQQLSIYLNSLNGIYAENAFVGGSRGGSLGLNYIQPIQQNWKWLGGLEINTVSWGNNLVANLGVIYSKDFAPKWAWSLTALTQQGIALFKPNPFYTFSLSGMGGIEFKINAKSSLYMGTGLRYYNCPEYKKYSLISSYLDFPVELGYRITLKK